MKTIVVLAVALLALTCSAATYKPTNETSGKQPGKLGYYFNGYYTGVEWGTIAGSSCMTNVLTLSGYAVNQPYGVMCGQSQNPPANVLPIFPWVSGDNEISIKVCNVGTSSANMPTCDIYCQMSNWDS